MMKHRIGNQGINIVVDSLGAQLTSITGPENYEYLWQGAADSWTGQSPILFPIVGGLEGGRYTWMSREYPMEPHGFARKQQWDFLERESDKTKLTFELRESEISLAQYPFPFRLRITYRLAEAGFSISFEVENTGAGVLPFSIGGHPAFNCPMDNGSSFSDYRLRFDAPEKTRRLMKEEILTGESEPFVLSDGLLPLDYGTFAECAIILRDFASRSIVLERVPDSGRSVRVTFPGFADLGIWTHRNAKGRYICIEPWFGVDSTAGNAADRDFATKSGMIQLPAGEVFSAAFTVSIT